jgi:hypothetical protein
LRSSAAWVLDQPADIEDKAKRTIASNQEKLTRETLPFSENLIM